MGSFLSGLVIGLGLVGWFLLLALVAGLYYLLWWRKKRVVTNSEEEQELEQETIGVVVNDANNNNNNNNNSSSSSNNYAKGLFHYIICWKKQPTKATNQRTGSNVEQDPDLELGNNNNDIVIKAFGDQESVETELMRLHNLSGPPRFLFTIKEETKEDLESEDGRSRTDSRSRKGSRTKSLSELFLNIDTPFLSPLASPPVLKSPTFKKPMESYSNCGFNPLFESNEADLYNRLRSSPPPKFKFLRDAEEKLLKKLMEEAEKKRVSRNCVVSEERERGRRELQVQQQQQHKQGEEEQVRVQLPQYPSGSSQVLPLASSPITTFRPVTVDKK